MLHLLPQSPPPQFLRPFQRQPPLDQYPCHFLCQVLRLLCLRRRPCQHLLECQQLRLAQLLQPYLRRPRFQFLHLLLLHPILHQRPRPRQCRLLLRRCLRLLHRRALELDISCWLFLRGVALFSVFATQRGDI